MRAIVRSAMLLAAAVSLLLPPVAEAGRIRAKGEAHYRQRGGHSGGYHHRGHRPHWSFGLSLGAYFRHSYHYEPYPYVVYSAPVVYPAGPREPYGTIDTDIKPSSATVYLDGKAVGIADDFDGYPSKLYVSPGKHTVSFREPGYRTMHVDLDVVPFHGVRVKERMEEGPDTWVPPVQDDDGDDADDGPAYQRRDSELRQPLPGDRSERPAAYVESSIDDREPQRQLRQGAELVLEVYPPDATVYVDGEVQSAAGVMGSLVVPLSPGSHRIEIAKPGFEVFAGEVKLRERQRQELRVRLDPKSDL